MQDNFGVNCRMTTEENLKTRRFKGNTIKEGVMSNLSNL